VAAAVQGGTAARPPPLAFHGAYSLGNAMIVVGGVSIDTAVAAAVQGGPSSGKSIAYSFEVRTEVWRWMDGSGWSLQFVAGGSAGDKPAPMNRFSAGAMLYWPEIGRLLLYGGQSDAEAWSVWERNVLRGRRKHAPESARPVLQYYPPIFSSVLTQSMKSDVLLLEEEACTESQQQVGLTRLNEVAKVCLPCSVGASVQNVTGMPVPEHRLPLAAPWVPQDSLQCVPCKAGTIDSGGKCLPCPPGFFGAFKGMQSFKMCWPCRAQSFSDRPGSKRCSPCPGKLIPNKTRHQDGGRSRRSRTRNGAEDPADPYPATMESGAEDEEVDDDSDEPALVCPMFAQSAEDALDRQSVNEKNEPHGENSNEQHLWWQETAFKVWGAVLTCAFVVIALVQSRRPRSVAAFMRRIDMRPITGAIAPSEAGGLVFLFYVVSVTCAAVVGIAHYTLYNTQLTSMSIPAQEVSARVGHIVVDLRVNATLVGYAGPCVSGDISDDMWEELDDSVDEQNDEAGARQVHRVSRNFTSMGRRVSELSRARGASPVFARARGVVRGSATASEVFVARSSSGDVERHRSPKVGRFGANALFRLAPSVGWSWLAVPDWFAGVSLPQTKQPRRLTNPVTTPCHSLLSIRATGLAHGNAKVRRQCERLGVQMCRVSLVCDRCSLTHEIARVKLRVAKGYMFTASREIRWEAATQWLSPAGKIGKLEAYSRVESVVTSGDLDRCLRGPEPSLVRMTLVPTDFQDLLGSSHLYGFVTQFVDAHIGSTTSPQEFHQESAELRSDLELRASRSFYKLMLTRSYTAFDFLAKMLGLLSGMSLIARVTVAIWHSFESKPDLGSCILTNPVTKLLATVLCFCVVVEDVDETDTPTNGGSRETRQADDGDYGYEAGSTLDGGSRKTRKADDGGYGYRQVSMSPPGNHCRPPAGSETMSILELGPVHRDHRRVGSSSSNL